MIMFISELLCSSFVNHTTFALVHNVFTQVSDIVLPNASPEKWTVTLQLHTQLNMFCTGVISEKCGQ
jgi:Zn-dependent protease with chaperone function